MLQLANLRLICLLFDRSLRYRPIYNALLSTAPSYCTKVGLHRSLLLYKARPGT